MDFLLVDGGLSFREQELAVLVQPEGSIPIIRDIDRFIIGVRGNTVLAVQILHTIPAKHILSHTHDRGKIALQVVLRKKNGVFRTAA